VRVPVYDLCMCAGADAVSVFLTEVASSYCRLLVPCAFKDISGVLADAVSANCGRRCDVTETLDAMERLADKLELLC